MYNFWEQSAIVQKAIAATIQPKTEWIITATKTVTGDWVFDIPPFVKDEAITNGSNTIIDTYFLDITGHPCNVHDTIQIQITTDKPKHHHAVATDFTPDPSGFGHTYVEQNTQMTGWFCPMFDIMFGHIPPSIYITFTP